MYMYVYVCVYTHINTCMTRLTHPVKQWISHKVGGTQSEADKCVVVLASPMCRDFFQCGETTVPSMLLTR